MASRIESYTVGGQVLISESVKHEAGDILRIDNRMEVLPKGAQAPISIYDIGGIAGQYNLALHEKDPEYASLNKEIPTLRTRPWFTPERGHRTIYENLKLKTTVLAMERFYNND